MVHFCSTCGAPISVPEGVTSGSVRCDRCGGTSEIKSGLGATQPVSFPPANFPQAAYPQPSFPPSAYPPPPNPYQSPNPWSDNFYAPGYFRPPDRNRALSMVQGPGILLQIYGALLGLTGAVTAVCLPFVFQNASPDERPILLVMFGGLAFVCLAAGVFTFWGGMRMKALRSYGMVLATVIFTFVVGFLVCLPAMLVGIWPLIVLLDAEVKACFDQPVAY